jgi:hypothetical protein
MAAETREYDWQRWPETEAFIAGLLDRALAGNPFAAALADRMHAETSTRLVDWTDHLVLTDRPGLLDTLRRLGFRRERSDYALGVPAWDHAGGMFPRLAVASGSGPEVRELAVRVESLADFSRAHDLGLGIAGYPLGPYRLARIPGSGTCLAIV